MAVILDSIFHFVPNGWKFQSLYFPPVSIISEIPQPNRHYMTVISNHFFSFLGFITDLCPTIKNLPWIEKSTNVKEEEEGMEPAFLLRWVSPRISLLRYNCSFPAQLLSHWKPICLPNLQCRKYIKRFENAVVVETLG